MKYIVREWYTLYIYYIISFMNDVKTNFSNGMKLRWLCTRCLLFPWNVAKDGIFLSPILLPSSFLIAMTTSSSAIFSLLTSYSLKDCLLFFIIALRDRYSWPRIVVLQTWLALLFPGLLGQVWLLANFVTSRFNSSIDNCLHTTHASTLPVLRPEVPEASSCPSLRPLHPTPSHWCNGRHWRLALAPL